MKIKSVSVEAEGQVIILQEDDGLLVVFVNELKGSQLGRTYLHERSLEHIREFPTVTAERIASKVERRLRVTLDEKSLKEILKLF